MTGILDVYKGCAPGLRGAIGTDPVCADCEHSELDEEVDCCTIHPGMYHDWDMAEESNFAYQLRCDDLQEIK